MPDKTHDATTVPTDCSAPCAICGALVDEHETISLRADDYGHPSTSNRSKVATLPNGEAHSNCFQRVASDPLNPHANAPPSVQPYRGPYYITLERLDDTP